MRARGALVTGSTGVLGQEVARRLAARGYLLGLHYRNNHATARLLQQELGDAMLLRADVAHWPEVRAMVDCFEAATDVEVVVNCAARRVARSIARHPIDEWEDVVDANLTGTFHVCRAALPAMLRRRSGSIVNVVSMSAWRASPGQAAYAASKAGVIALTRTMAWECGRRGVRVNAVAPGFFDSEMTSDVGALARDELRRRTPIKTPISATAVITAIEFFLDSPETTGQVVSVDGGLSLS